MLLGLPAIGLFCLFVGQDGRTAADRLAYREAFAFTAVAWAAFSVVVAQLLSLGAGHELAAPRQGHLTRSALIAVWIAPALAGAFATYRHRAVLVRARVDSARLWQTSDGRVRFCIATTAICIAIVGLVALVAAPNTWDSMTYHLSRVVSWIRLGGVAHYATNVEPQLYQPPGAEILVAQWQLLIDGDRMAATVQWVAFAGAAVMASLAAARLGAARFGQVVASLMVVTTPMAVMQGSSTQNDLLTAFWLLIAVTLALGVTKHDGRATARTVMACLAVGLAVLTKGTALIYGAPVIAMILAFNLRAGLTSRRVVALAIGAVLVLVPGFQHAVHNHSTYGTYLATGSQGNFYKNQKIGLRTIVSNSVRNASVHLNLPDESLNRATEKSIRGALDAIGIDPDDPANTFEDRPFEVGKFGPHEDHAGNLAMLLLSTWAICAVLFVAGYRSRRRLAWAAMLATQALLFCALLKWQIWHARLHLPIFVLAAPLVAVCLERFKKQLLVNVVLALIVLAAPVYLFYNYTRPLVGERSVLTTARDAQYFFPRRNIEAPYRGVLAEIQRIDARDVGLVLGQDDWVYAFHALAGNDGPRFREVLTTNPSKRYTTTLPNTIVCVNCDPQRIAYLQSQLFERASFAIGPITHDPNLDESDAEVTLWRRSTRVAP